MNTTCRVVIKGVKGGFTEEQVTEKLAALFKTTEEQVKKILASGAFPVKKGIDLQTAAKYQAAIEATSASVTHNDRFKEERRLLSNGSVKTSLPLGVISDSQLFAIVRSGTHPYFRVSAYDRKFSNDGVVLFENGLAGDEYRHTVSTKILKPIDKVKFSLQ